MNGEILSQSFMYMLIQSRPAIAPTYPAYGATALMTALIPAIALVAPPASLVMLINFFH